MFDWCPFFSVVVLAVFFALGYDSKRRSLRNRMRTLARRNSEIDAEHLRSNSKIP